MEIMSIDRLADVLGQHISTFSFSWPWDEWYSNLRLFSGKKGRRRTKNSIIDNPIGWEGREKE